MKSLRACTAGESGKPRSGGGWSDVEALEDEVSPCTRLIIRLEDSDWALGYSIIINTVLNNELS